MASSCSDAIVVRRRPQSAGAVLNMNKMSGGLRSSPKWTMRGKPSTRPAVGGALARSSPKLGLCSPDPGEYQVVPVENYWMKRAPTLRFTGLADSAPRNWNPGPGAYEPDLAALTLERHVPQAQMCGKDLQTKMRPKSPGPKYDIRRQLGGQARTMADHNVKWNPRSSTPGPTTYTPPRPPCAGRGETAPWQPPSTGQPWPGRTSFIKVSDANEPGPGHYNPGQSGSFSRKPCYSLGLRRQIPQRPTPQRDLVATQFA